LPPSDFYEKKFVEELFFAVGNLFWLADANFDPSPMIDYDDWPLLNFSPC